MKQHPSDIIRSLREGKGWTQEHAARVIGISVFTLSLIERGKIQNPMMLTCQAIARGFGVPLGRIWEWAKSQQ